MFQEEPQESREGYDGHLVERTGLSFWHAVEQAVAEGESRLGSLIVPRVLLEGVVSES